MIAMQLSIQLQYPTCRCDSPSLERKYSDHGSYRGAQRRTFEVGLCLSVDAGERLVRKTVARRGRFWLISTSRKSGGKLRQMVQRTQQQSEERLAAQCKEQLSKCPTNVQRTEKSA